MHVAHQIKKNDTVYVIAGKDRGKKGRVLRVVNKRGAAIVEGVQLVKRHTKPNPQKNVKGGIVEKEAPVHLSNLLVVCSECGKPARLGRRLLDDGRKVRTCRKCKATIDK